MKLSYKWIAADPDVYDTKPNRQVNAIILHSSGGHEAGDIRTLTGQTDRVVSSHWYITKDGRLFHFVQDSDIAYHAGRVASELYSNEHTIGIEQEHMDGMEPWPVVQIQTCAKLIAYLQSKFNKLAVKGHSAVAPGRKVDPVAYPWELLRSEIAKIKEPVQPVRI